MEFNPALVTEKMVAWLQEKVQEAGAKGVIVGLSGGIDSAVVAAVAKRAFPEHSLGVIMPCHSNPEDAADARLVAEILDIPYITVDLTTTFDTLLQALGGDAAAAARDLAASNVKPRLRMITLYYHAARHGFLVLGTGNRSELTMGYFTKYGDGGVDLLPLGDLVKHQVRDLAKYLGIPAKVIEKAPTAGLWDGQTDEGEMGITYRELDDYILTGKAAPRVKEIIDRHHQKSAHKRQTPPIFRL